MRKLLLLSFLLISFTGISQILNPVTWKSAIKKVSDTEYLLVFDATIEPEWHVYSQFTPENGPLPMEIKFEKNNNFSLIGSVKESPYKKQYNDVFEVDEYFFANHFTLQQKVKVNSGSAFSINAKVEYQVCKDVCINQDQELTFAIPKSQAAAITATPNADTAATASPVEIAPIDTTKAVTATVAEQPLESQQSAPVNENKSLWSIFFIAFLSGFAALLTPCVFPLIPMTVSFFTKQSKTRAAGVRNAITYGISIIVIYVILGSVVTAIFGADALNALATNVWFNLIFFILLVVFAASFLGAFELVLPNSWANKVDRQADRGGIIGILFMALALAIVSFSCTGPIVGTLLFESASRGGIGPIVGMLGFSLALALPFMIFAMFPGWLNTLPKSGGWLNTVKAFLGFLELALAFKFLSNADLVLQLHLLEREVFLAIWIAIFGALALYLFGKIQLPHDSILPSISVGRLFLGLLVLTFTIYLVPGLWGAPLKLISAFPPPMEYSESPLGIGSGGGASTKELPEGAKLGPQQIVTFHDYESGLAYAKSVNKPILLDFTGRACVNCRKMENNVWSDQKILPILNNEVVLISLYVDEDIDLPKEQQFVSKTTGSKIETVGDKWTDFMISKYNTNTQPLYVLTDLNGNSLNVAKPTISYVSINEYYNWLRNGISAFKK